MEKEPEKYNAQKEFFTQLERLGLVDEVREGIMVDASAYEYVSGEEFSTNLLINTLTSFLSAPMLIDSFESHEEDRIPAFNESGILTREKGALYLNNKLRVNKLNGVLGTMRSVIRVREFPESFRSYVEEQTANFNLETYSESSRDEKIKFAEAVAVAARNVLNRAIAENIISGPTV